MRRLLVSGSYSEEPSGRLVEGHNSDTTFTMANMANSVRKMVSKNKRRFVDEGYDLDLTYISGGYKDRV